jgi:transposase
MRKTYIISQEASQEAQKRMEVEKKSLFYRRLQVIFLKGQDKTHKEISEITGFHPVHISKLVRKFDSTGFDGLLADGRKGGNHRYLSLEEEEKSLADYVEQSNKGQVLHAKTLWHDYEEKTGKTIGLSGFYRLLHRHGWRLISSRPEHPKKASDDVVERSKKLTLNVSTLENVSKKQEK